MTALREEINSFIHNDNKAYTVTEKDGTRVYYRASNRTMFSEIKNCNFIIIYKPRNKVCVNLGYLLEAQDVETMKAYIASKEGKKVNIVDGELKTDSTAIQDSWEDYKDLFIGTYYYSNGEYYDLENSYDNERSALNATYDAIKKLEKEGIGVSLENGIVDSEDITEEKEKSNIVYVDYDINDFEIYMTYEEGFELNSYDSYVVGIMKTLQKYEDAMYISVPICSIFVALILVYLIMAIGYKKDQKQVELNDIDKIPLEIIICVLILILCIIFGVIDNIGYSAYYNYYKLFLSGMITAYFVIYILFVVTFTSTIKRIKAKTFIKNTITWRILRLLKRIFVRTKKAFGKFIQTLSGAKKIVVITLIYIIAMGFILIIFADIGMIDFGILVDIGITIYVFYKAMKRVRDFKKIEEHLKNIYEGDNKERLIEEEFTPEFKQTVKYVNDISNGFENAVQEGIKSERLKTELITNVSHDIKTPLTSIINYADLIKRENVENEKVKEYIDILLNKSHRLKRLTEDLVEASKVSSGNVKLNLEKLDIAELINQTTGEFEDKFKEKNLDIIRTMPKENIFIEADSRYMYRIIENIFSNISKYALERSRVYVDITKNAEKVKIEIKNISREKLNISEEELMQRFVRGDKSRTTEGSGLRTFNIKKPSRTSKRKL